jgi:uncharacterized protein (DUF433 family)
MVRIMDSSSLRYNRAMNQAYVENRDRGYYLSGTRVSLDSIVYAFRRGASPETIKGSFPTLTLEQVYGAIAFYLSRQPEIDEYLRKSEEEYEAARQTNHDQLRREQPELWERLMRVKDERTTRQ